PAGGVRGVAVGVRRTLLRDRAAARGGGDRRASGAELCQRARARVAARSLGAWRDAPLRLARVDGLPLPPDAAAVGRRAAAQLRGCADLRLAQHADRGSEWETAQRLG